MRAVLSGAHALGCDLGNRAVGRGRVAGRPIFVTGNGRSGTTWLGETLSRAPGVFYYSEPCHPDHTRMPPEAHDPIWSRHLRPGDGDPHFERRLGAAFAGHVWRGSGHSATAFARRMAARPRIVVKEVASFASLEWVVDRWDPDVLVILRHPGAYAASVRAIGQDPAELARFRLLRDAPSLRGELSDLGDHLARVATPLEAIVASWAIRTRVALRARERHPDWRLIHYEALAARPVERFRALYGDLGLTWTPRIEAWIRSRTETDRPGSVTVRRSSERIHRWRDLFDAREIASIRAVLEPFELPVYAAPEDWP